jgi:hypothetical protein
MLLRKACFLLTAAFCLFLSGCSGDGDDGDPDRTGLANPKFGYVSSNWNATIRSLDMHDAWHDIGGVDRVGKNYYLLPKATGASTSSDRFRVLSNYFQAWFGMYTVEDDAGGTYGIKNDEIVLQDILNLAIADQKAWLSAYITDPLKAAAITVTANTSDYTVEDVEIDGCAGWKISGTMTSTVDVGFENPPDTGALDSIDQDIWMGQIAPFDTAILKGVFYVWYAPENKELNVIYYNGVKFDDLIDGSSHDTLPAIRAELDRMAKAITVYED